MYKFGIQHLPHTTIPYWNNVAQNILGTIKYYRFFNDSVIHTVFKDTTTAKV